MRGTTVRDIWKAGGNAVSGWLQTPDILAAETIASLGFDAVCVDLQHGTIDMQAAVGLFQAISTSNATPLARPTACEPAQIMKLLDAGAFGIICPMVNTGEESERLVAACHYAPRGNRSFGPVRAAVYAGSEYMAKANDTIFSLAMIETRQALDNIDDIVSVKGLTGLYLGLSDLSISLGYPPAQDSSHGEILGGREGAVLAGPRIEAVDEAQLDVDPPQDPLARVPYGALAEDALRIDHALHIGHRQASTGWKGRRLNRVPRLEPGGRHWSATPSAARP
ncbi:MAG: 2,4-dihydroxyhept-2-ene-1,7-dioic acid aldolase [Rhizobiales bacterium]|nr:2,4-dihydroxyhept-2-ene-1,7-dioic acid aldolase [Hyphomicrobiales bacterium]